MGRWTTALEVAMPRLCPAMALRQLLEQHLRRPTQAASPAPTPHLTTATTVTALAAARTSVGSVR
jgi:hypothetical protein